MLPAETALAERFQVNRHTIRRALDELVRAGLISRHQGRGTQVVDHRLDYRLSADSKVTRSLAESGMNTRTDCMGQGLHVPPQTIARHFGRGDQTPMLCVETLRWTNEAPLMRLRHWFDEHRVPDWPRYYRGGSTRACLSQYYGLTLHRRHVSVEAVQARSEDARLLQCAHGTPLLLATSYNVDDAGALVEISVGRARADRLAYQIDFDGGLNGRPMSTPEDRT